MVQTDLETYLPFKRKKYLEIESLFRRAPNPALDGALPKGWKQSSSTDRVQISLSPELFCGGKPQNMAPRGSSVSPIDCAPRPLRALPRGRELRDGGKPRGRGRGRLRPRGRLAAAGGTGCGHVGGERRRAAREAKRPAPMGKLGGRGG
jgi:hypothetical protein